MYYKDKNMKITTVKLNVYQEMLKAHDIQEYAIVSY